MHIDVWNFAGGKLFRLVKYFPAVYEEKTDTTWRTASDFNCLSSYNGFLYLTMPVLSLKLILGFLFSVSDSSLFLSHIQRVTCHKNN
jgi:hypothetical protein